MSRHVDEIIELTEELNNMKYVLKEQIIKQNFLIKLLDDQTSEVESTREYIQSLRDDIKKCGVSDNVDS